LQHATRGGVGVMQTSLKCFGSIARTCAIIAGWALMLISVATCVEILGRKYFDFSFRGLDELGGYMLGECLRVRLRPEYSSAHARHPALPVRVSAGAIVPQCAGHAHPCVHGGLLCLARPVRSARCPDFG